MAFSGVLFGILKVYTGVELGISLKYQKSKQRFQPSETIGGAARVAIEYPRSYYIFIGIIKNNKR